MFTTILAEAGKALHSAETPGLCTPHTDHDELVLPISPERLVEPERLRLDSAQHGPGAEEGKRQSARGRHPEEARSTSPAPSPPRARHCGLGLHSGRGHRAPPPRRPGPLGPSPLAQPGRALPGAQGLESFLGQESEVIAAQVAGLPCSHGGPNCAEVGLLP